MLLVSTEGSFNLDSIDRELADAEIVLACLDRNDPGPCEICTQAEADGTLAERPSLEACARARSQGPA